MNTLTIRALFDTYAEKLELNWTAGRKGGERRIWPSSAQMSISKTSFSKLRSSQQTTTDKDKEQPDNQYRTLVGHLNLIHPNQIQVLGGTEIHYLSELGKNSFTDAVRRLFIHEPACIIIADGEDPDSDITAKADDNDVPLFRSELSSDKFISNLSYYLTKLLADHVTLHGVFMEVMGAGVLIAGSSGVGKSELALELVSRGHRLIADDAPEFSRVAPDTILGSCPIGLADFLEVRGLGIVNIRTLFGDNSIKRNKYLRLIVRLQPMSGDAIRIIDRLEGSANTFRLLDVEVPEVTLPVAPGRNLAVLVECAVRVHVLRSRGYNATSDFIEKQRRLIEKSNV